MSSVFKTGYKTILGAALAILLVLIVAFGLIALFLFPA